MHQPASSGWARRTLLFASAALLAGGTAGCINQWNTKLPTPFSPRGAEYDRREAQVQDPFPDSRLGPDTDSRPPQFSTQRANERKAKEQFGASLLRQQYGGSNPSPPDGGASMLGYPEAVAQ